ncbi:MAG: polyphosphate kinase 1 [Verrucomicrobiaceae bacterium]|nr:MAG: polyphosphate kinase 1 [Verrucomicrobiaceae bacterium]
MTPPAPPDDPDPADAVPNRSMKSAIVDGVPFRSKEVSWLSFNSRVLQEADDPDVPLLERLKFLGIYSSNLDEFFRVRIATLRRLVLVGRDYRKLHIPDPKLTLREARAIIKRDAGLFDRIYHDILAGLSKEGIRLIEHTEVPRALKPWLTDYFYARVRPRIMPIMIRSYSQLGSLRDHPMYLAVEMMKAGKAASAGKAAGKARTAHALIEIPATELPRFVVLPEHKGKTLVMYLDDIIRFGLPSIFSGLPFDKFEAFAIKFTRDAEMGFEDDVTESLYDKIAEGLRSRQTGQAVRMNYDSRIPAAFLKLLVAKLKLAHDDTLMPGFRYHNRKDLVKFPAPSRLGYPPESPLPHPRLSGQRRESFFRTLQEQDLLLHLPWHSFNHFLDFLREASLDQLVESIYLTQYRLAGQSCVARALMNAAQNGKDVTVLIEPQARFDEKNNIEWANRYQNAGVKVILGVPGLKVHAKMCLVVRHEGSANRFYSAIGTGNFNEETSRFYTDHMLLTAHPGLGADVLEAFRFFRTNWQPPRLSHLVAAPISLRTSVKFLIQNEISHARQGKEAGILVKLNNLADPEITALLYEASQAGVQVRLIVRSMFSVVTGGTVSKNIRAIGIVDRYLEHSRILCFANGGSPKYFLSSADFLPRNFDSRFEVLCPIYDPLLQQQLQRCLDIQWADNTKARVLDKKLANHRAKTGEKRFRAQEEQRKWLARKGG